MQQLELGLNSVPNMTLFGPLVVLFMMLLSFYRKSLSNVYATHNLCIIMLQCTFTKVSKPSMMPYICVTAW